MDRYANRFDERIASVNNNDASITEIELTSEDFENLTEDQIRSLFRGMQQNTHVQKLDLCWTPQELRRTVCQQLLPLLLQENSSIEYLQFPYGTTNAEFESIREVLRNNNTTVKTLHLASCNIRGREGGEIIARLIRHIHHIISIDLEWNRHLGSAGATRIASALGEDDCALKTLNLDWCGIGYEGVDALCTALQVNNSSETFWFYRNQITNEGYRALARSLPYMNGLREIRFEWEQRQVSAAVLQQMMDGLHKNQSLQRIAANDMGVKLSAEQRREWNTCCAFVGARNKMNGHLDEVYDAAGDGRVTIPIGPLLLWCCRQGNLEVQASLIYSLLHSRSNKLVGLADITAEDG